METGEFELEGRKNRKPIRYEVNENGCWNCISHAKDKDGYPRVYVNGKGTRAYRYIYIKTFKKIPVGMLVRHKCDNPLCINPNHLEIGTHQDNMDDRGIRHRHARGESSGMAKLNQKQVDGILKDNRVQYAIAKEYDVCPATISLIKNNKIWGNYKWQ